MERAAWTDERLDDFRGYVEKRFDQVDTRFDLLDGRLDRVDTDIRELRREVHDGFGALRGTMVRVAAAFAGAITVGFLALVGAVLQVS